MIDDILKPKSDKEILRSINENPCAVERFTLGFCYYFEKDRRTEIIPELIATLQNPLIKITVNIHKDVIRDLSKNPYFIEHEIIVESTIQDKRSSVHFGIEEYKRKMIVVRYGNCYIMP
jgi:hypothetical protein